MQKKWQDERRRVGEKKICLQPTVKQYGGSVQACGCISAVSVDDLVRIEGTMNADNDKQILIHNGISSGRRPLGDIFVFWHDNHPKHTANVVKTH